MEHKDKIYHIIGSGLIVIVAYFILNSILWAMLISYAVGAIKELVWDGYLEKGTPSVLDMVANGIGILFTGGMLWLMV